MWMDPFNKNLIFLLKKLDIKSAGIGRSNFTVPNDGVYQVAFAGSLYINNQIHAINNYAINNYGFYSNLSSHMVSLKKGDDISVSDYISNVCKIQ